MAREKWLRAAYEVCGYASAQGRQNKPAIQPREAGRIAGLFSDCGSAKRGEVRGFMEKKRSGEALGLNDGRYRNLEWSKDERQNSD